MNPSPGDRSYDAIVVGLGGIGSAAAYRLAAAPGSPRILGLEQFELGHDRGASQDQSRITRLSYHRREYVELAIEAQAAWREVEAADVRPNGRRILTMTGGLDLAPPKAAESIDDYADAMAAADVPFEWLDDVEVVRRWPAWRLRSGTRAIFQADAGIADPEQGNAAHQALARAAGAELLEHARVATIDDRGGELAVTLDDGRRITAGSVVVTADAWTNDLLEPLGQPLPLTVTREQVTWYEPEDPSLFEPERFAIWIWLDQPSFYGFPSHAGRGPKLGQDVGGRSTTATTRSFDLDLDCLDRCERFLARHLPAALGRRAAEKTCLYTLTPDRDFVIDRVPGHPGIVVALGAAHGYKFAALFGRVLADLALDPARRPPDFGHQLFAMSRPALAEPLAEPLEVPAATNLVAGA
jgi:sarcosine oxidase